MNAPANVIAILEHDVVTAARELVAVWKSAERDSLKTRAKLTATVDALNAAIGELAPPAAEPREEPTLETKIEAYQPPPASRFEIEKWADDEAGWGENGAPGIMKFASAVQVWSALQNRPTSIAECARVFNVDPQRVIEAVEEHSYMSLIPAGEGKLMIAHGGG